MKHFLITKQVDISIFMFGRRIYMYFLDCFGNNETSTRNVLPVDVGSTIY